MTIPAYAQPYGLRDVKITPLGADGSTPGTGVDLPAGRIMHFSDAEDFTDLRGDDKLLAKHGNGARQEWSLESGGISLDAYAVMAGGTVTSSGVTPNVKKTYSKKSTDSRPYFKAEGQAISDNGGDLHGLLYKCKADSALEGEMGDGAFWISNASGTGFPSTESGHTDKVYDFIQNETATAIT